MYKWMKSRLPRSLAQKLLPVEYMAFTDYKLVLLPHLPLLVV